MLWSMPHGSVARTAGRADLRHRGRRGMHVRSLRGEPGKRLELLHVRLGLGSHARARLIGD